MPKTTEFTEAMKNLTDNMDQLGIKPERTDELLGGIVERIKNYQKENDLSIMAILNIFGNGAYGLIDIQRGSLTNEIISKTAFSSRLSSEHIRLGMESITSPLEKRAPINQQKEELKSKINNSNAAIEAASAKLDNPVAKTKSGNSVVSELSELAQEQDKIVSQGKSWLGREHKSAEAKLLSAAETVLRERQNKQNVIRE